MQKIDFKSQIFASFENTPLQLLTTHTAIHLSLEMKIVPRSQNIISTYIQIPFRPIPNSSDDKRLELV